MWKESEIRCCHQLTPRQACILSSYFSSTINIRCVHSMQIHKLEVSVQSHSGDQDTLIHQL